MSIALAEASLAAGNAAAALDHLLEAWRTSRSPAIADAIDAVGARVDATLPAIEGKNSALHRAWLEVAAAGTAADHGRLLAAMCAEPFTKAGERIASMASRPEDPRLASALVTQMIAALPRSSRASNPTWTLVFRTLTALGDSRVAGALAAQRTRIKKSHGKYPYYVELIARIDKLLGKLPKEHQELDDPAALARIVAGKPRKGSVAPTAAKSADDFLRDIVEHPDDDAPRLVFADWLTQRGDPRGEFIALQCAPGPVDRKRAEKIAKLLRPNKRRWLGPVEPAIHDEYLVYERGFLAGAEVQFKAVGQRNSLLASPWWGTLRSVRSEDLGLIASPALRGLRAIHTSEDVFVAICESTTTMPGIEEARVLFAEKTPAARRAIIGAARGFPGLRRLAIDSVRHGAYTADEGWILATPLAKRLDELTVNGQSVDDWMALAARKVPQLRAITFLYDRAEHRGTRIHGVEFFRIRFALDDERDVLVTCEPGGEADAEAARLLARLEPKKKLGAIRFEPAPADARRAVLQKILSPAKLALA